MRAQNTTGILSGYRSAQPACGGTRPRPGAPLPWPTARRWGAHTRRCCDPHQESVGILERLGGPLQPEPPPAETLNPAAVWMRRPLLWPEPAGMHRHHACVRGAGPAFAMPGDHVINPGCAACRPVLWMSTPRGGGSRVILRPRCRPTASHTCRRRWIWAFHVF